MKARDPIVGKVGPWHQLSPPRAQVRPHSVHLIQPQIIPAALYPTRPTVAAEASPSPWANLNPTGGPGWVKVYPDLADSPVVTGDVTVTDVPTLILGRNRTRRVSEVYNNGSVTVEWVAGDGTYGSGVPLPAGATKDFSDYIGEIYLIAAPGTTCDVRFATLPAASTPPS